MWHGNREIKKSSLYLSQLAHPPGSYPSFYSITRGIVLPVLLSPGWDARSSQGYPPQHFVRLLWQFAGTHFYSWVERGAAKLSVLSKKQHNDPTGSRTWNFQPRWNFRKPGVSRFQIPGRWLVPVSIWSRTLEGNNQDSWRAELESNSVYCRSNFNIAYLHLDKVFVASNSWMRHFSTSCWSLVRSRLASNPNGGSDRHCSQ